MTSAAAGVQGPGDRAHAAREVRVCAGQGARGLPGALAGRPGGGAWRAQRHRLLLYLQGRAPAQLGCIAQLGLLMLHSVVPEQAAGGDRVVGCPDRCNVQRWQV